MTNLLDTAKHDILCRRPKGDNAPMELERKFYLNDQIDDKLEKEGFLFVGHKHQRDTYYLVRSIIGGNRTYLRLRHDVIKDTHSLDYHVVLGPDVTEEHETTISNALAVEKLFSDRRWTVKCIVDKKRNVYKKEDVEVVVDSVDGLGSFVEVEITGAATKSNLKRLDQLCDRLGLKAKQRVSNKGYPELIISAHKRQKAVGGGRKRK